jgi:hypothetical protein
MRYLYMKYLYMKYLYMKYLYMKYPCTSRESTESLPGVLRA